MQHWIIARVLGSCLCAWTLAFGTPLEAQTTWQRTIGGVDGDQFHHMVPTSDGNYLLGGACASTSEQLRYVVKIDAVGDTLWTRSLGDPSFGNVFSLDTTAGGGCILFNFPNEVVKLDQDGAIAWSKILDADDDVWKVYVTTTADGGFILTYIAAVSTILNDIMISKFSASATHEWTRRIGGADAWANRIRQTSDGGYIVTGFYEHFSPGTGDLYLLKLDASGQTEWARVFGGMNIDEANDVVQISDGGYIAVGYTYSWISGETDTYVVRTTSTGDTLWTRTYTGIDIDEGFSIRETIAGDFVIGGMALTSTILGGGGEYDVYLMKIAANGDLLWSRTYGAEEDEYGHCAEPTPDGGYLLAGRTRSFGEGSNDGYLIKTDADGMSGCHEFVAAFTSSGPPSMTATVTPTNVAATAALVDFVIPSGHLGVIGDPCDDAGVAEAEKPSVRLFPDPSTGRFSITGLRAQSPATINVQDATGASILSRSFDPEGLLDFDLGSVTSGVYTVWITAGGRHWCERLVVTRYR